MNSASWASLAGVLFGLLVLVVASVYGGRRTGRIILPRGLHPLTGQLVVAMANALALKLLRAQVKYGHQAEWSDHRWMPACRAALREHMVKGDPLDVIAYAAFLWWHKAPSNRASSEEPFLQLVSQNPESYQVAREGTDLDAAYEEWVGTAGTLSSSADLATRSLLDFLKVHQAARFR